MSVKAFSRPRKHSANVKVYSYIFGCIIFPQIEISVSYKIRNEIAPAEKNEIEMRKNKAANKHLCVAF